MTSTDNVPAAGLAWGTGLGLDYGLSEGFVAGLDFLYGPNRSYSVSNSLGANGQNILTQNDSITINQYSLLLTPGWRFKVGDNLVVEPRLGLGVMEATMAQKTALGYSAYATEVLQGSPDAYLLNAAGTYTTSSSGLGFAIWPEIRGEYLFGQFGVGLSLGYLVNTPTPQKYTAVSGNMANLAIATGQPTNTLPTVGAGVGYLASPTSTTPTRWYLNTDGLTFGLFVSYHFQPLFW